MKTTPKQSVIKIQATKSHFTAIIEKKKHIVVADADLKKKLTTKIEGYNKKNSEAKLAEILKLLTPKETKAKTELMVTKKKLANERKTAKRELSEIKGANTELTEALDRIKKLEETNKAQTDEIATLKKAAEVRPKETPTPVAPVQQQSRREH